MLSEDESFDSCMNISVNPIDRDVHSSLSHYALVHTMSPSLPVLTCRCCHVLSSITLGSFVAVLLHVRHGVLGPLRNPSTRHSLACFRIIL